MQNIKKLTSSGSISSKPHKKPKIWNDAMTEVVNTDALFAK